MNRLSKNSKWTKASDLAHMYGAHKQLCACLMYPFLKKSAGL